jgi:hypothetical protein
MRAVDVTDTLELAPTASGSDNARVLHKPKLLSDNGPSYIATELAEWTGADGMSHVRDAPLHPQTQGKIRTSGNHHRTKGKDQTADNRTPALSAPQTRRLTSTSKRGRHSANTPPILRQMF